MKRKRDILRDLRKTVSTGGKIDKFLALAAPLIPALLLIASGFAILLAPRLLIAMLACLFICSGAFLAVFTWKVMLLQKRLVTFLRGMEGRVILHRPGMGRTESFDLDPDDDKKVILH